MGRRHRRAEPDRKGPHVRLGYSLNYWSNTGLRPADHLGLVREAERLGYDSVWASEAYGTDPAALMAWLAGQTERIGLGSGILEIPGRRPGAGGLGAATRGQAA